MGIEPYFVKDAVVYYRNKTRLKDIYGQARNWARDESLLQEKNTAPILPLRCGDGGPIFLFGSL